LHRRIKINNSRHSGALVSASLRQEHAGAGHVRFLGGQVELAEQSNKLNRLLDKNPNEAIHEALNLSGSVNVDLLKAAILVDAGGMVKDFEAILKGVEIFRHVIDRCEDNSELNYNLANGLHALALSTTHEGYSWYGNTEKYRLEARNLFYKSANDSKASVDTQSQSFTNLGNLLWASYRWVEAYDFYSQAMEKNSRNAVASSGALKMLRYALGQGVGDPHLLTAEIEHLAYHVNNNIEGIYNYAGEYGVNGILSGIKDIRPSEKPKPDFQSDDYKRFFVSNNLTLSPTIHSHTHESKYWDDINISSVTSSLKEGAAVPEIFAMVNVIKSDFIMARQLLFDACQKRFNETGSYNDTLDYACYGVNESALALAQRSALDILDKISVASLSYLGMGGAKKGSMKSAWFAKSKKRPKRRELDPTIKLEIENGNAALLALTEISRDLSSEQGFLWSKQSSRNSSTHRFTVLHDMGISVPKSASGCVEHFDFETFAQESSQTLKLARAAVVYFVQMVLIREKRLAGEMDGISMPLFVPSHEYIRGHDE